MIEYCIVFLLGALFVYFFGLILDKQRQFAEGGKPVSQNAYLNLFNHWEEKMKECNRLKMRLEKYERYMNK